MTSSGSEKRERNENFDEDPREVRRRTEEKASKKTFHGKPCDICGDVGFEDLLATCSNCCLSREHLYCMRVYRKDFPRIWHCEACQRQISKEKNIFTSSESGEVKKRNTLATESGLGKMLAYDKTTNQPRAPQSHSRYNPSVTGKVKFIPTEDAVMLHSGGKPRASTMVAGSSSQPGLRRGSFGASHRRPARRTIVCPFTSSRSSLQKEPTQGSPRVSKPPTGTSSEVNVHRSVSEPLAFPTWKSALASECPRKRKIEEDRPSTELDSQRKSTIKEDRRPRIVLDSPRITKKDEDRRPDFTTKEKSNESGILELDKSTGKQHSMIPSSPLGKKDTADSFFPHTLIGRWNSKLLVTFQEEIQNPPAANATWKGSFEVVDEDCPSELYAGFWAHPPEKVSRKAYEVSKKMPEILQFKLHPRCERWPDIFQKDAPSNADIALYFFPGDFSKSKEKYNGLVELIEKRDLVMQCCMDGVELLIFTSKQLPVDSQRLNMQFYLWGVSRSECHSWA